MLPRSFVPTLLTFLFATSPAAADKCRNWTWPGVAVMVRTCQYDSGGSGYYEVLNRAPKRSQRVRWTIHHKNGKKTMGARTLDPRQSTRGSCFLCSELNSGVSSVTVDASDVNKQPAQPSGEELERRQAEERRALERKHAEARRRLELDQAKERRKLEDKHARERGTPGGSAAPAPPPPAPAPKVAARVLQGRVHEGSRLSLKCPSGVISRVLAADYGAQGGNRSCTRLATCVGKPSCSFDVTNSACGGDPKPYVPKELSYRVECSSATTASKPATGKTHSTYVSKEADGKRVRLHCASGKIRVIDATYGQSCNAPRGFGRDHLAQACNGKQQCDYQVSWKLIGDPAAYCPKDYRAAWRCE